jgi:alpha-N-arabinofuranosidase
MRTGQGRTIAVVISLLCCAAAAQAENLLRNSSFEAARENNPRRWTTQSWGGKADFSVETPGRNGGKCVKIASADGADAGWIQTVQVPPFAKMRLSGWVKTENIQTTTGRGVQISIHDNSGARTAPLKGTNDWTELSAEFQVAGASEIQVICLFGGWGQATGTAWFDDITLEVLEERAIESKTVSQTIAIDPQIKRDPISPYIYGQFIEHMGRCIYGGIWAEMLEDRKFFYPVPAEGDIWGRTGAGARVLRASPWKVIGTKDAVRMTSDEPLSGAHSVQVSLGGTPAGISQDELGLLAGKEYTGRVVLRGDSSAGPVSVSLVWGEGDSRRQAVTLGKPGKKFKAYPIKFVAGADSDNARLEITASGKGSFVVGAVSLMPADNVKGFRKDTLALLKELDSPIYRWPGGNFVSGYDWRDGLGDRDKRPTRSNPAWTGIETNDVGMHEFIELCRLLDTEPLITVNTGFGDAYSAKAEVEYANGSTKTLMGKWRAQNGSREPFNVKWWCVGNEMWGNWQLGYMSLEHYVVKHNWVEDMMRQADPSIITVASGDFGSGFSEGLLKHCSDHMDHIAEHFYCQTRPDLTEHVRLVPNAIKAKADAHRKMRQDLPQLKGKRIPIAMTEWNYWYGPHVFGELGTRYFMKDALGIAAGLHEYFRSTDVIGSAFYAQTVNVIGCIKTTKTSAGFDTTAYPLVLYRSQFGTQPLGVTGSSDQLDVAAALTDDGKYLTIGIVNATWDTYEITFDTGTLKAKGKADTWVIAHENPMIYNNPGEKPAVEIVAADPVDLARPFAAKPVSITLLKIPVR